MKFIQIEKNLINLEHVELINFEDSTMHSDSGFVVKVYFVGQLESHLRIHFDDSEKFDAAKESIKSAVPK